MQVVVHSIQHKHNPTFLERQVALILTVALEYKILSGLLPRWKQQAAELGMLSSVALDLAIHLRRPLRILTPIISR